MDCIDYDYLALKKDKNLTKQFRGYEEILISVSCYKFNEKNKRQERNLLITTLYVYNLDGHKITRKTELGKITAVTVSRTGSEFVLHVPDEYDYRYASFDHRDQIIQMVLKSRGSLPIHFKEDISLSSFTTTKIDIKKAVNKQPVSGEEVMNELQWMTYVSALNEGKSEMRKKTMTVFAQNCRDVALDDFDTIQVLGKGGFAKVTLVEKKDTRELLAMKGLKKNEIKDFESLQHVKNERKIWEVVEHPFLLSLLYAFQTPDHLYFVSPFMKGGELFQYLRKQKRFKEENAKFFMVELILGIEFLHSKNIVYRDLKPQNILLDEQGHIKLTDYGLSKFLEETPAQTICGTPHYLAPEVINRSGHSYQVDWWALGVCLYELLYGVPPFYNKNQDVLFKMIQEKQVLFPVVPQTSAEAKDLIAKLLTKDPQKRLGAIRGAREISEHSWFNGVDWQAYLNKQVQSPIKPKTDNEEWQENFESSFREDTVSTQDGSILELLEQEFENWSFSK